MERYSDTVCIQQGRLGKGKTGDAPFTPHCLFSLDIKQEIYIHFKARWHTDGVGLGLGLEGNLNDKTSDRDY
jgi:hypothetical protein